MLRIGKRDRKGVFNSIEDPTKLGQGSAILEPSHAVKESGNFDIWGNASSHMQVDEEKKSFLLPLVQKPTIKAPKGDKVRAEIDVPAVSAPHGGASYNPAVEAHQDLLQLAHDRVAEKERETNKYAGMKEKMEAARKTEALEVTPGVPAGMTVDVIGGVDEVVSDADGESAIPRKAPVRKTKQQRRKAEKQREEVSVASFRV
jgi:nucleolar protein 53